MPAGDGGQFHAGTYTGTGVALKIEKEVLGFEPKLVHIYNLTDGSFSFWHQNMTDAHVLTQKAGTTSHTTSNGITPLASGFQVGTDAAINASGDVCHWIAWG